MVERSTTCLWSPSTYVKTFSVVMQYVLRDEVLDHLCETNNIKEEKELE